MAFSLYPSVTVPLIHHCHCPGKLLALSEH